MSGLGTKPEGLRVKSLVKNMVKTQPPSSIRETIPIQVVSDLLDDMHRHRKPMARLLNAID